MLVDRITGRVYVAGAENDGSFTDDARRSPRRRHSPPPASTTRSRSIPPLHGFAVPDNLTYDEAAAERHWSALEDLYAAMLTA